MTTFSRSGARHPPGAMPVGPLRRFRALMAFIGLTGAIAIALPGLLAGEEPGHPTITRRGERFFTDVEGRPERIRDVSAHCMDCHGGNEAGAHGLRSLGASHPVDVRYPDGAEGYVRRRKLDPRLVLSDRRITCLTCHDHARADHGLVLPARDGDLCVACHET